MLKSARRRVTAVRSHICDILNGEVRVDNGLSVLTSYGVEIKRVYLIGVIVDVFKRGGESEPESSYCSLSLDDGTGVINLKSWGEDTTRFGSFKVGDVVEVIGLIREYNDELYVVPESVTLVSDIHWELFRELEIIDRKRGFKLGELEREDVWKFEESEALADEKSVSEELTPEEEVLEDSLLDSELQDLILEAISRLNKDAGVTIGELVKELKYYSEREIISALNDLLNDGLIYEPNPGKYKIM